ncbi:hypothetical protein VDQ94_03035 [Xanthomonas campestris pv. campestris]|nr:hypothetical protein [Xanthomonas campestris pv. campestris]MEB1552363.1 hypothetical protein [Xanthomonas campestris pv. campestris]
MQTANSKQQTANSKQQTANSRQHAAAVHQRIHYPMQQRRTALHQAFSNRDLVFIKIHARKPAMRSFSLQERCQRDRLRTSTVHATCRALDYAQFRITCVCLHRIAQASPR